ncbi:MAG: EamA family transporter, partial [Oscillospiraceae bacterium]
MLSKKRNFLAVLCYFNICFIWGTNNLVTRIGVSTMSPLQFSGMRFLTAGIVLSLIALIKKEPVKFTRQEYKNLFFIGGVMFFLTNGCVVYGNKLVDSGIVTVLLSTIPIFTTLLGMIFLKDEKPGISTFLGLIFGFLGIVIVALWGNGSIKLNPVGVIITLAASAFWSFGSIYSQNLVVNGSAITQTAVEALFASVLLLGTAIITKNFSFGTITKEAIFPILYLAVVDSVVAFLSYGFLLKAWPISKVCTYAYINPIVA